MSDVFGREQLVPIERWLFGQFNRLFPAKASLRALAVIAREGKEALLLQVAAPRICETAARLGDYLRFLDRRFAHHRDEALATAFPEGGAEGEKGRIRYQDQFVGHTVKGEQGGLLVGLKLAIIQTWKNRPIIFPTSAGWEFARLPNPIIDAPMEQDTSRLSEAERTFLLSHIKEGVPVELFAYRAVLSLIAQGKDTPELVNQGLARYRAPTTKDEDLDFVATQKNGALGRMSDLGLVERERSGTRITYVLTEAGKKWLDETGVVEAA